MTKYDRLVRGFGSYLDNLIADYRVIPPTDKINTKLEVLALLSFRFKGMSERIRDDV